MPDNSEIRISNSQDHNRIIDLLTVMVKGIKTSLLYPPDNPIPKEFKKSCWEKISSYLNDFDHLDLDITSNSFNDRQKVLVKSSNREENIAGLMHRDGIRFLCFRAGLQQQEWDNFFDDILTVIKDADNFEDLVNLFWQHDFVNIEYEAVDEFVLSEIESDYQTSSNAQVEYSEILNIESQENRSNLLETISSESELEKSEGSENELINKVVENIHKFTQLERLEIEQIVAADEELIIEFEAIDLILDVFESEQEQSSHTESVRTINAMFDKMLDNMQFPMLVYLIKKMKETFHQVKEKSSTKAEKLKDCLTRTGDKIRITKITNLLNKSENIELDGIRMYLEELEWEDLPSLIWMLGELEYFPARRMVIQSIVNKGRDKVDIVGNAVFDSRWYVVRNAVLILGEIRNNRAISFIKKALEHFDERVRWEAVVAVEKIGSERGYELLIPYLIDESERVRTKVVKIIDQNNFTPAFSPLQEIIKNSSFNDLPASEQKEYIQALLASGGENAVDTLIKLVKKKSLFSSDKYAAQNEAALKSLASLECPKADKIVSLIAKRKKGNLGNLARVLLAANKSEVDIASGGSA